VASLSSADISPTGYSFPAPTDDEKCRLLWGPLEKLKAWCSTKVTAVARFAPSRNLIRFGPVDEWRFRNQAKQITMGLGLCYRGDTARAGIVAIRARSTAFTDSASLKSRATSGSSSTATDPFRIRPANRFGFAAE
jgi:hypothetical protein